MNFYIPGFSVVVVVVATKNYRYIMFDKNNYRLGQVNKKY